MSNYRVLQGDNRQTLKTLSDGSVHCVVTSPPYFGLRDYGVDGQIGLEQTPDEYVAKLVEVFREVCRVLRDDGTLWLNLGDSYYNTSPGSGGKCVLPGAGKSMTEARYHGGKRDFTGTGLKPKDLIGIPWRVAFALQADGWYLRSDIIWHKPNPMPESVTDRPTKAHEYIFLLTKSERYFYDAEAIKEPATYADDDRKGRATTDHKSAPTDKVNGIRPRSDKQRGHSRRHAGFNERWDGMTKEEQCGGMRNKRDVWTVATKPYPEAHFATFPSELIEPCVLAGCPMDGTVLDPFAGSGTTLAVALQNGRNAIGCELNPAYVELIRKRITDTASVTPKQLSGRVDDYRDMPLLAMG